MSATRTLAFFDGRDPAGIIMVRTDIRATRFVAITITGETVGEFATQREAMAALPTTIASPSPPINIAS
jgi:hypothetical protein